MVSIIECIPEEQRLETYFLFKLMCSAQEGVVDSLRMKRKA